MLCVLYISASIFSIKPQAQINNIIVKILKVYQTHRCRVTNGLELLFLSFPKLDQARTVYIKSLHSPQ